MCLRKLSIILVSNVFWMDAVMFELGEVNPNIFLLLFLKMKKHLKYHMVEAVSGPASKVVLPVCL